MEAARAMVEGSHGAMAPRLRSMLPRSSTGPMEDHDIMALEFKAQYFLVYTQNAWFSVGPQRVVDGTRAEEVEIPAGRRRQVQLEIVGVPLVGLSFDADPGQAHGTARIVPEPGVDRLAHVRVLRLFPKTNARSSPIPPVGSTAMRFPPAAIQPLTDPVSVVILLS